MELFLSKLAAQLVYPLALSLWLAIAALALQALRKWRLAATSLSVAVVVLWLASTPILSARLQASLEWRYPAVSVEDSPSADAIVVLGGSVAAPAYPRREIELTDASDRVLHAARLYRAGKAGLVIAAGGNIPWLSGGPPESALMASLLEEWGVPRKAVLLETSSLDTRQNAVQIERILAARGLRTVLLVTSALHMPRALATFRTAGVDAIPSPTDYSVVEGGEATVLSFLPDAGALGGTTRAVKEYLGLAVYRSRGWIHG